MCFHSDVSVYSMRLAGAGRACRGVPVPVGMSVRGLVRVAARRGVRRYASTQTPAPDAEAEQHLPHSKTSIAPPAAYSVLERGYRTVEDVIGQPTPHTHPHLLEVGEVTPGIPEAEYTLRRSVLLNNLPPDSILVVPAYPTKIMTHDIPWPFRQESNFLFLTGCQEPDAVAVFVIRRNDGDTAPAPGAATAHARPDKEWMLFVGKKDPRRELWEGIQTGVENAAKYFGPDRCHAQSDFEAVFTELLESNPTARVFVHKKQNPACDAIFNGLTAKTGRVWGDAAPILAGLRAFKNGPQINMHVKSAAITEQTFRAAMKATRPGLSEAAIYAVMEFEARVQGANWLAYPPVIAGGASGLSLHYVKNDQLLRDGDLLLVDAGAELYGHPTDVTRTWPVGRRFTDPQRRVYESVLRIQKQLLAAAKPGVAVAELQHLNRLLTAEELLKLGILSRAKGDAEAQASSPTTLRVFPHAFGHFMGMDIHESPPGMHTLRARMMHTIEPGIYIPACPTIPEEYHGICVRIEDNIVLTDNGHINLTDGTPKEVADIEDIRAAAFASEQRLSFA